MKAIINLWETGCHYINIYLSASDLTTLPSFLRFNILHLKITEALNDTQSIADKCLLLESLLQSVKPASAGSELYFYGTINKSKSSCFHDHLELLNFVRDRLLPICDKSRKYKFKILLESGESASQNVISSILQTPQLNRCSSAQFDFDIYFSFIQLPVKEISNWLHRKCDREQKKLLHIYSREIENLQEMVSHLREVNVFMRVEETFTY